MAGEDQPSWALYPRKQPQARPGLTGHSRSACLSVPRSWIQKDIFLSPLQPFLGIFSLHNLSEVFKSLVQFLWPIPVLGDHHLLTNLNSLLDAEAFCSQAFCRRLPIHSHSSLNYHNKGELLRTSSLSGDFKYSLFVSRQKLHERLLLPQVSMTAALLANTLETGPKTAASSHGLSKRAQVLRMRLSLLSVFFMQHRAQDQQHALGPGLQ